MAEQNIKKNFILSTFYQILTLATPFITAPYVSRIFEADGIGIQSYTSSVRMYFSLFAALGTASYGAREIAQNRNSPEKYSTLFWEIELLSVFTTFVCLIGWGILIYASSQYRIYYLVLTLALVETMFDISWFYAGLEQFKYTIIRNAFFKILGIVLLFVFIRKKEDLVLFMLMTSAIGLLGTMSMWMYLPKFLVKVSPKTFRIKRHFKETVVYFIPSIATSVYTVLDKTLIGLITHAERENGYYEQATKVINMVKSLTFASINMVLGPRMSYLFAEKNETEIKTRLTKSIDYILFIGIACCCGLEGIADVFVSLFFGSGYDNVILAIRMLSPIVIIIGLSNCLGSQYYTPAGLRGKSARFIIAGSVVNLCLNLLLIPKFKSYGAIIGSLAAEGVITLLYVLCCDGYMTFTKIFALAWKKVVAGCLMTFSLLILGEKISAPVGIIVSVQIFAGSCIYFILLLLLRDSFMFSFALPQIGKIVKKGKR